MTKRLHFLFQCSLHGLQLPKLLCLTMHFSKTLQGVQIHSFHDQRKVLLRFSSRTSCIFSNKMNAGMGCFLDYIEGIHFLVLKVVVSQWTGCQLCPSVCHFQRTRWWCVVGCSRCCVCLYTVYTYICMKKYGHVDIALQESHRTDCVSTVCRNRARFHSFF